MSQDTNSNEKMHSGTLSASDERVLGLTANLYQAMEPQAALSSRATFSLLSSITLLGLSLASAKPETVEVLGFTIRADHWLFLAVPLALVVAYSVVLLVLAWEVEKRRFKYVVHPLQVELLKELESRMLARQEALEVVKERALKMELGVSRQEERKFFAKWDGELAFLNPIVRDAVLPVRLSRWMSVLGLAVPLIVATGAFAALVYMAL